MKPPNVIYYALTVTEKLKKRLGMAEVSLDTFKVTYSFWKDVVAIAVGILLADVARLVFQLGIYYFFLRH